MHGFGEACRRVLGFSLLLMFFAITATASAMTPRVAVAGEDARVNRTGRVLSVDLDGLDEQVRSLADRGYGRFLGSAASVSATVDASVWPVVPVGADGGWTTDGWFLNTSSESVTQKIGHLTFTKSGFDPIVIEPTITLLPGEQRRLVNMNENYDRANWIVPVDPRLAASVFLTFGYDPTTKRSVANFEVQAIDRYLAQTGDALLYQKIATDASTGFGAYPTILNTDTQAVQLEVQVFGPKKDSSGSYPVVGHQFVNASRGISQFPVQASIPDGGSVKICRGTCAIGAGGGAPIFAFIPIGASNGTTQSIRYGQ